MAPPFVGVAVKMTDVPLHMVVAEAATVTDGARLGLTVMIVCALVALVGAAQVALLVRTTHTLSLLASVALV